MNIITVERIVLSKCTNSINITTYQKMRNTLLPMQKRTVFMSRSYIDLSKRIFNSVFCKKFSHETTVSNVFKKGQENIPVLQLKKRIPRTKMTFSEKQDSQSGLWSVKALATAEEYNLEGIYSGLLEQKLYLPDKICTSSNSLTDVIYAIVKYEVSEEIREIFFFREGTVVMWNFCDLECGNILKFLKRYEHNNYSQELIHNESESMAYTYIEDSGSSRLKDGNIVLATDATRLEKYSFSSAIALSVKLGIWEASLDQYIDSIEFVTEDLKTGKRIRMSQQDVLRKQGELFALKHLINLSSDLLDTPDFYWERDDLEKLYQQTRGYFSISKRTRVINEKLSHCIELISILSSHVSDRHHIRLEWMIIILIMVEVVFEILHYLDRYLA